MRKKGYSLIACLLTLIMVMTGVHANTFPIPFVPVENGSSATDEPLLTSGVGFAPSYGVVSGTTYILQNAGNHAYVGTADGTLYPAIGIHYQLFTGLDAQKWTFVRDASTNRYKILLSNNYGLGALTTSTLVSLMQGYFNDDNNGWTVEPLGVSSRRIKIMHAATGRALSVAPAVSGNTQLILTQYTNDADYSDEWYVYPLEYSVNLNIEYDASYVAENGVPADRFNYMMTKLKEVYALNFHIDVNLGTSTQITTYADSCNCTYDEICAHSTNGFCVNAESATQVYSLHHTNLTNILMRLSMPNKTQNFKAFFMSRKYCVRDDNGDHCIAPYYGLCYPGYGLLSVTNKDSLHEETKTFVHEFNHIYGAKDHYGLGTPTTQEMNATAYEYMYSEYCIHGEKKDTPGVYLDLTLCDGCMADIYANNYDYNHP